ncbi:MAG: cation:proton antiporter [Bryobacteraceae bacterium]
MNVSPSPVIVWSSAVSLVFLGAAFLLAFVRLLRGPSLPDRVVALDLMSVLVVGLIAVHTVRTGYTVYLDVAIVLGLISFLGTVAFARYITLRGSK